MPKVIELTVEIDIQKVSCPGVWLCQDGRVSLSMFALGTSYQTCLLPPIFPLMFKDFFYFRKRFQQTCALNNICCLLKDETIYCELVQWCEDCMAGDCIILAQYLGALNDVLFPPNMCSNDGVDLLMRRSKDFPGILSPKIEIATKVRIDEIWNQPQNPLNSARPKKPCHCVANPESEGARQKQVCHSAQYHRNKCNTNRRPRSGSRSRSSGSKSCCSLVSKEAEYVQYNCPNPVMKSRVSVSPCRRTKAAVPCPQYDVYTVRTPGVHNLWRGATNPSCDSEADDDKRSNSESINTNLNTRNNDRLQKLILESRYVDDDKIFHKSRETSTKKPPIKPCVCEICKRYHELFHSSYSRS